MLVKTWFPNHADLYSEVQRRHRIQQDLVDFVFPHSPFCGTSFNLGPVATSKRHTDLKNFAGGICVIGALGSFNHETSGHLVLVEAKLILEFMDGDLAVLPSAALTHANTPIRRGVPGFEDEWRMSIVQYTSGGLLRWLWQGEKLADKTPLSKSARDARNAEGRARWTEALDLFPTLEGILSAARGGRVPSSNVVARIRSGDSLIIPP